MLNNVYIPDNKQDKEQFEKELENCGIAVGMRHIASSAAALRFPETWLDAVRVGSALVDGLLCGVPVKLQKAHVCKARVVAVKALQKGDMAVFSIILPAFKEDGTQITSQIYNAPASDEVILLNSDQFVEINGLDAIAVSNGKYRLFKQIRNNLDLFKKEIQILPFPALSNYRLYAILDIVGLIRTF
mgnify:CR=1 FL=1